MHNPTDTSWDLFCLNSWRQHVIPVESLDEKKWFIDMCMYSYSPFSYPQSLNICSEIHIPQGKESPLAAFGSLNKILNKNFNRIKSNLRRLL